jgi:hypothetical protein
MPDGGYYLQTAGADFYGDRFDRTPKADVSISASAFKIWVFIIYSNNLIGVAVQDSDDQRQLQGVFTPDGYIALDSPVPLPENNNHYGSYNPVTKKFVVASVDPVNWA